MKTICFYGYIMICVAIILQCVYNNSTEKHNRDIQNNMYEQSEKFEPFEVHAGEVSAHNTKEFI